MRWAPDLRRAPWSAALLVVLTACGDVTPAPAITAEPEPSRPTRTAAPLTPRATPSSTPHALGTRLPRPGRPYSAADILEAMRDSRRPGGVPDQVETEPIAARIAAMVWTVDGRRWSSIAAGGSCGPARCTLDVAGSHPTGAGEDLWTFEIIPASSEVIVLDANLRSLPPDLPPILDRAAREDLPQITRDGLLLTGTRWLPPPDEPGFRLSYRSGDEEGSCELELRLDPADGAVVVLSQSGC